MKHAVQLFTPSYNKEKHIYLVHHSQIFIYLPFEKIIMNKSRGVRYVCIFKLNRKIRCVCTWIIKQRQNSSGLNSHCNCKHCNLLTRSGAQSYSVNNVHSEVIHDLCANNVIFYPT